MTPTLYPTGYESTHLDLDALMARHHEDRMHPEFARRLRRWLVHMAGEVGIGGSWRAAGSQPDQPGFAPEGKSFHQSQLFASGRVAFAAVDLVRRDGPDAGTAHDGMPWHLAPVQGSAEAARWGVHINVGVPGNGESWHMQPVEIDGFDRWVAEGRPDPDPNYPTPPYPTPEDDPMPNVQIQRPPARYAGFPWFYLDGAAARYAFPADVEYVRSVAGDDAVTVDTAARYANLFRQVYGAAPEAFRMVDGTLTPA